MASKIDPELYEAAMAALNAIEDEMSFGKLEEERLRKTLGHRATNAFERWRSMLVSKYIASPDDSTLAMPKKPPNKFRAPRQPNTHPWKAFQGKKKAEH